MQSDQANDDKPVLNLTQTHRQDLAIFQAHNVAPQELVVESLFNHLIVIHTTPQPVEVVERADSLRFKGLAQAGSINIHSAGSMASCRWSEAISFIRLDISPQLIEQVAEQVDTKSHCSHELINIAHTDDAKILQISQWLLDEQKNGGSGGQLYIDSLLNVLAVHLLRTYTTQFREARSPKRLTQEQVSRTIDYMHAHLDQDISLEVLAQSVNLSPSHLRRLFKQATGMAPHQYLINLRINRAKELLLSGGFSVNEVAAEVGFADQSHLHRHFKRIFGVTPKTIFAS
ncbi:AraC family transcriptional regulator [Chlorogloeopsis sp. ULAP01]|uniref:helix-turn-helix domain-containing protein n=1 Tax=Chlorogloeopsis sp. ULAP01 TaxID=3056483 RepID=UPI0025AA99AB|nr:AraC family transcriptional regulator [Chlorogloeopsis sp. ULAP01]MDM9379867.1 AraC family transcriptional regulator [Chlorogloeopsis sp. ULAP01]